MSNFLSFSWELSLQNLKLISEFVGNNPTSFKKRRKVEKTNPHFLILI